MKYKIGQLVKTVGYYRISELRGKLFRIVGNSGSYELNYDYICELVDPTYIGDDYLHHCHGHFNSDIGRYFTQQELVPMYRKNKLERILNK